MFVLITCFFTFGNKLYSIKSSNYFHHVNVLSQRKNGSHITYVEHLWIHSL